LWVQSVRVDHEVTVCQITVTQQSVKIMKMKIKVPLLSFILVILAFMQYLIKLFVNVKGLSFKDQSAQQIKLLFPTRKKK